MNANVTRRAAPASVRSHQTHFVRSHKIGAVLNKELGNLQMSLVRSPKQRHLPPLRNDEGLLSENREKLGDLQSGRPQQAMQPHRRAQACLITRVDILPSLELRLHPLDITVLSGIDEAEGVCVPCPQESSHLGAGWPAYASSATWRTHEKPFPIERQHDARRHKEALEQSAHCSDLTDTPTSLPLRYLSNETFQAHTFQCAS